MDALQILPKEMWSMIFDLLVDRKDLVRCYYTCNVFRELLQQRAIMKEGLQVMQHHLHKLENEAGSWFTPNYSLSSTDILNCRLISKQWKSCIDQLLQHHPLHHKQPHNAPGIFRLLLDDLATKGFSIDSYPNLSLSTMPKCVEKLEAITSYLRETYKPKKRQFPFPSRRLQINIQLPLIYEIVDDGIRLQPEQFKVALKTFLQLKGVGEGFWHLEYSSSVLAEPLWHEMILDCLKLMPNLRTFSLELIHDDIQDIPNGRALFLRHCTDVQQFVRRNIFPKISSLVTVQLNGVLPVFTYSLLLKNSQVKKVVVKNTRGGHWMTIRRPDDLPALETFQIMEKYMPHIPLRSFNWPLTKLHVNFEELYVGHPCIDNLFSSMCEFFEQFKNTFKILNITLDWRERPIPAARLPNLPHLEKLKLEYSGKLCLDLILPLGKTLKILKVVINNPTFAEYEPETYTQEQLQFKDCVDSLEESNLWEKMPGLKLVKVDLVNRNAGIAEDEDSNSSDVNMRMRTLRRKYEYRRWKDGISKSLVSK